MQIMFSYNAFFSYIKVDVKGTEFVFGVDSMNTRNYWSECQKSLKNCGVTVVVVIAVAVAVAVTVAVAVAVAVALILIYVFCT